MVVAVAAVTVAAVSAPVVVATAGPGFVAGLAGAGTGTGAAAGGTIATVAANAPVALAALGPVGWMTLGAADDAPTGEYTFDCWKPVLRDATVEPSAGRLLKDVAADARIKRVIVNGGQDALPEVVLENVWDERFFIQFVTLPSQQLAAHAARLL